MISDEERREVAKRLRNGGIARNSEEAYVLLLSRIGIRPQLPAASTYEDAMVRLADLIDRGGELEDRWSAPYMAFADEQAAKECAEKRTRRGFCRRRDEMWCAWSDYTGSTVCSVDVLVDYFGAKEVSSGE